jgi:hypothetical protein
MTREIWAAIAIAIIGLINSWLVAGWTTWMQRPAASPAADQVNARKPRQTSRLKKRFAKLMSGLVGSAVPVGLLVFAMTRPEPMTRWNALAIALSVGWLMVQVAIGFSVYIVFRSWPAYVKEP